jgi:alkanesulfonate monooxygenase SsuD/methylene tetrahydromethanopterin reductase-like flavin-dependent oxidoreductase (luciferase family)
VQFPVHDPLLLIPMMAGGHPSHRAPEHAFGQLLRALYGRAKVTSFHEGEALTWIEHRGKYFNYPGFSPITPSPQGHPVLIQAGASGPGRDFCAKWAEGAFTIQLTSRARRHSRALSSGGPLRASQGHRRRPDHRR